MDREEGKKRVGGRERLFIMPSFLPGLIMSLEEPLSPVAGE